MHCQQAYQLLRDISPVNAEFEAQVRDLYWQLGQAYALDGQTAQAQAVFAEGKMVLP